MMKNFAVCLLFSVAMIAGFTSESTYSQKKEMNFDQVVRYTAALVYLNKDIDTARAQLLAGKDTTLQLQCNKIKDTLLILAAETDTLATNDIAYEYSLEMCMNNLANFTKELSAYIETRRGMNIVFFAADCVLNFPRCLAEMLSGKRKQ